MNRRLLDIETRLARAFRITHRRLEGRLDQTEELDDVSGFILQDAYPLLHMLRAALAELENLKNAGGAELVTEEELSRRLAKVYDLAIKPTYILDE